MVIHLLLANGSLCQTINKECKAIRNIIQIYKGASAQSIYLEKSSSFFSNNTSPRVKRDIKVVLRVKASGGKENNKKELVFSHVCFVGK